MDEDVGLVLVVVVLTWLLLVAVSFVWFDGVVVFVVWVVVLSFVVVLVGLSVLVFELVVTGDRFETKSFAFSAAFED